MPPFIKGRRLGGLVGRHVPYLSRPRDSALVAKQEEWNMMEDETGQDVGSPQDARLDSLDERLKRAQIRESERTGQTPMTDANEQLGQRVLSTLLGGLFGGTLIGWLLDRWLGTGPWLLIVMMVLGTVGGFWSIIKLSSRRP
ncbi:MAG TPA: AtpZ/AtpI family protein [Sphingomicrobium sp.]|nr:AtpZ/AtpI family protein [Sphingomicrobium sp.]